MSHFKEYAKYYNLIYRDRNYESEADYLIAVMNKFRPETSNLVEFGCGTGRLAKIFVERGYSIQGVELSEEMITEAQLVKSSLNDDQTGRLELTLDDIRTVRLGNSSDAIISVFHVISYLQSDDDLSAAFLSAFYNLKPGGLFLFDVWYGPAVLSERPEVRVTRCDDECVSLLRIAEPVMRDNENLVDVNYEMIEPLAK